MSLSQESTYFYNNIPIEYECSEGRREEIIAAYPPPVLPTSEEAFTLENEVQGNHVKVTLLLNDFSVEMTKTNKQFLKMRFSNNNGAYNTKMWDNQGEVETYVPMLEEYSVFTIEGKVEDYRGFKSITVHKMTPAKADINPYTLLAYTHQDMKELTVELFSYLDELQSPFKEIGIAAMDRFWGQFSLRPAAKGFHHNYLGGLLKHTVGLMRFARYIMRAEENHYKAVMKLISVVEKAHKNELWQQMQTGKINTGQLVWKETIDHLYQMLYGMMNYQENEPSYDIIMTSILFHDIGKMLEYDHAGKQYDEFSFLFPTATADFSSRKSTGIIMDQLGVMVGHIPYGVLFFTRVIEAEGIEITMDDLHAVAHCILSHHGLPEWGSCIRSPQTVEGYIVHIVDYLDSRYENTEQVK
ncbi:HD domain-containing protein [Bacillus sp. 1P06AnD]|uniref:HD domain-containing protein n=1 Tax=Bacillus sp. 1P06AnD TaxID=3132208 RepID=UPI00399FD495